MPPEPNRLPDLTISDESAAEMVAAMVYVQSRGKPRRIRRTILKMRRFLEQRSAMQKVVKLRSPHTSPARAPEALARLERVAAILGAG